MDPLITLLVNAPTAVAVIVVVRLFLADRAKDRSVWENHLSSTVEALTALRDEQRRQGEEARDYYRRFP